jgi:hypothetical protein
MRHHRDLPLLWLPALPGPGILAFAGVLALLLTRLRGRSSPLWR